MNGTPVKTMLIGLGDLGSAVLDLLVRESGLGQIVVASRNASRGGARVNLARIAAEALGRDDAVPPVRFIPLDLDRPEAVVEMVHREAPDIVLSTATRQTWWVTDLLPEPEAQLLRKARFGVWLPLHLALTLKLMQALRAADYRGLVLTAPFPDVVNPVLARLGLAPSCGVGNVDEVAAKVRLLASENLRCAPQRLRVMLVAHHALEASAVGGSTAPLPPHFLRLYLDGDDVTERAGGEGLLRARYAIPDGAATCLLTAASIVRLLRGLASDQNTWLHAPAPGGLPGGYPVMVGRCEIHVAPIPGLTIDEAIALNEASHKFDGVERIEPDGTVRFCSEDAAVLREALGYDAQLLKPHEADDRAKELMARLRDLGRRRGVDLDQAWQGARPSA
jgi:hypothetical protein